MQNLLYRSGSFGSRGTMMISNCLLEGRFFCVIDGLQLYVLDHETGMIAAGMRTGWEMERWDHDSAVQ